MIEKKLEELFDFQRFERNGKSGKLDQLIRETENRYAGELSDEELGMVNAAGETGFYTDPVFRFIGGFDRIRNKVFGSETDGFEDKTLHKISTGKKIGTSKDDPVGNQMLQN